MIPSAASATPDTNKRFLAPTDNVLLEVSTVFNNPIRAPTTALAAARTPAAV